MTEPYNLTFGQIRDRIALKLRLPGLVADVQDQIMTVLGEVYRDVCAKQDWWWLLKKTVLTTQTVFGPGQDGGTDVSTVATVRMVDDEPPFFIFQTTFTDKDLTNWVMIVPGLSTDSNAVFRITGQQPLVNNAWLLDAFTGESASLFDSAGISVNIYQDSIPLPAGVEKVTHVRRYGRIEPLERVGIEDMGKIKSYDQTVGKPEMYSVYDSVFTGLSGLATGQRMLQIHPYPDHAYKLDIWYKEALTTDLDPNTLPLIPTDFTQVLIYGALAAGYAQFLNDLDRSMYWQAKYTDTVNLMAAQQREYASDKSGIFPSMNPYRPPLRNRPRTSYTLGNWFDILPNRP